MIDRLNTKRKIVKVSILTTLMFTHTGCFFGYFENPLVPIEKPAADRALTQTSSAPVKVVFPTHSEVGCVEEISTGCNKAPTQPDELKVTTKTSTGGEIHKLQSIQGKNITIVERSNGFIFPEYKDKVVILEMFGKTCSHCLKEMPILNKLRRKYRGKVEIVAVQVEDRMNPSEANYLLRRHGIHYPVIHGDTATNLQYNIQNTYGWTGILPFTMVVKNGVTEFTYPGEVSYNEINHDIRTIIQ